MQDLGKRVGKLVLGYGASLVSEITAQDIGTLIFDGDRSAQTIVNDRRCLATFFGWALKHELCVMNIALKIEPPKVERGSRKFSH